MATTCKLIAKQTLGSSATSVTFSSIPQTFDDLLLVFSARSTRDPAAANQVGSVEIRPNSSTTNLTYRYLRGDGASATSGNSTGNQVWIPSNSSNWTANTFGNAEAYFPNYAGSTYKSWTVTGAAENNNATAFLIAAANLWSSTSSITSLVIAEPDYSLTANSSFYLYGITKA